jgi:hypothetical protein
LPLLLGCQFRIHRKGQDLVGSLLCVRKLALLVAQIRVGGLEVDWYRIVDSGLDSLLV